MWCSLCPFLLRYEITACIYIKTEISETAFKIQAFMHHYPYKLRLTTLI